MNASLEKFTGTYVVVPKYTDGGYGIYNIDRGDMTDAEWKTWLEISSTPEIKAVVRHSSNPGEIPLKVMAVLEAKGISKCLINQERPII